MKPSIAVVRTPRDTILYALLTLALLHAVGVLLYGIASPLLDLHAFRQTQTAITAYWLLHGGSWLAYETPILGAPWSVPFEFPVYQLIVAAVAKVGVPLDVAGRLVGFAFFLGALWPLRILFDALRLGRPSWLVTAILFVSSPLYLYWSRTFMIESCALFFGLLWLALFARFLAERSAWTAVFAIGAGCLGVLAKATTFPAFAVLGCLAAALTLLRIQFAGRSRTELVRTAVYAVAIVAVPFVVGTCWVVYSDGVKAMNPFGSMMTSSALQGWNFGSLDQKLSAKFWIGTVGKRMIPDTLGVAFIVALALIAMALTSLKRGVPAAAALVGFLVPLLVFTNLHAVHNYYQYANALFLIAAAGFGVMRLFDLGWHRVGLAAVVVIAAGQIGTFYATFAAQLRPDTARSREWNVAQIVKSYTSPGQGIVIIGNDWSSQIPYLAERKAVMLAAWFKPEMQRAVMADPQRFLGDQRFGAVVYCSGNAKTYGALGLDIAAFVAGRAELGAFADCKVLTP